jgi:hypothetical protein
MKASAFSIDSLTNSGLVLKIDGRELRFAELRVKDYGRMQEHLRRIQPKPSDMVEAALIKSKATPQETAQGMIMAYEMDLFWPASVDSKVGMTLIQSDPGARSALIRYSLEKHHPDLTETEAAAIAESMSFRLWSAIAHFAVTGHVPGEPDGEGEPDSPGESRPPGPTGTT